MSFPIRCMACGNTGKVSGETLVKAASGAVLRCNACQSTDLDLDTKTAELGEPERRECPECNTANCYANGYCPQCDKVTLGDKREGARKHAGPRPEPVILDDGPGDRIVWVTGMGESPDWNGTRPPGSYWSTPRTRVRAFGRDDAIAKFEAYWTAQGWNRVKGHDTHELPIEWSERAWERDKTSAKTASGDFEEGIARIKSETDPAVLTKMIEQNWNLRGLGVDFATQDILEAQDNAAYERLRELSASRKTAGVEFSSGGSDKQVMIYLDGEVQGYIYQQDLNERNPDPSWHIHNSGGRLLGDLHGRRFSTLDAAKDAVRKAEVLMSSASKTAAEVIPNGTRVHVVQDVYGVMFNFDGEVVGGNYMGDRVTSYTVRPDNSDGSPGYGNTTVQANDLRAIASLRKRAISDAQVRSLAAAWHGGQSSPLYALTSSGAIIEGCAEEVDLCIAEAQRSAPADVPALKSLLDYVKLNGVRGPQQGWSNLWDDSWQTLASKTAAKIPPEAVEKMRAAISQIDSPEWREKYRNGDYPRADSTKDVNKRYRWDLLWAACSRGLLPQFYPTELYDTYNVNDSHIDTALRNIVPPIDGTTASKSATFQTVLRDILSTNPGLDRRTAQRVAHKTVQVMTKQADSWRGKCSAPGCNRDADTIDYGDQGRYEYPVCWQHAGKTPGAEPSGNGFFKGPEDY